MIATISRFGFARIKGYDDDSLTFLSLVGIRND